MSERVRWRVSSARSGGLWWANPDGVGWPVPFDTWEEAMRFADEQARTVTVTLPRKAATMQSAGYQRVVRFQYGDNFVYLAAPEHAEPFALALLARARKDSN